jgi:hypothetical protein
MKKKKKKKERIKRKASMSPHIPKSSCRATISRCIFLDGKLISDGRLFVYFSSAKARDVNIYLRKLWKPVRRAEC